MTVVPGPTGGSIQAITHPACYFCGMQGGSLHENVVDTFFQAPGVWGHLKCTNPACGLVWINPMPLPSELGKAYRSYYTHKDTHHNPRLASGIRRLYWRLYQIIAQTYLADRMGYDIEGLRRWHHMLLPLRGLLPDGSDGLAFEARNLHAPIWPASVLDVGCGNGNTLIQLANLGWTVEGIDIDPAAVTSARSRGLNVREGDLFAQHYRSENFDAVLLSHVLEHVYDPIELLAECRRVLRPGGVVVLFTPNVDSLGHKYFGKYWRGLEVPRHLMLFSVRTATRAIVSAGLRVDYVKTSAYIAKFIWWQSVQSWNLAQPEARMPYLLSSRFASNGFALIERVLTAIWPNTGEEVVAVASRV